MSTTQSYLYTVHLYSSGVSRIRRVTTWQKNKTTGVRTRLGKERKGKRKENRTLYHVVNKQFIFLREIETCKMNVYIFQGNHMVDLLHLNSSCKFVILNVV